MRKLILLLMTIGLSACGKQFQDPDVTNIVNQFVQDAAAHGKNLQVNNEIEFGDVGTADGGTVIGKCVYDNVDNLLNGKIILNKAWWDNATDINRKMVVYHECFHCVLHQGHRPGMMNMDVTIPATTIQFNGDTTVKYYEVTINVPSSIMNPVVPTDSQLSQGGDKYYEYLMNEAFNR